MTSPLPDCVVHLGVRVGPGRSKTKVLLDDRALGPNEWKLVLARDSDVASEIWIENPFISRVVGRFETTQES